MAKFTSIFRLKGTLENMTFSQTENGEVIVRRKTSVDRARIANDPAFVRTRENGREFGHSAQMGRFLRRTIVDMLMQVKDRRSSNRLQSVFSQIKNLDTVSARGERRIWVGLETTAGRQLLRGFDFNNQELLQTVVLKNPVLDTATSTLTLSGFRPSRHLVVPQGATHASFRLGVSLIQFEENAFETAYSEELNFEINETIQDFVLTPDSVPEGEGRLLYFFMVSFFQEVNGVQYPLNNGAFNVLNIIEVL